MEQVAPISLLRPDEEASGITPNQDRANVVFQQRCLLIPGVVHLEQEGGGFREPQCFRVFIANDDAERAVYRLQSELFKKYPGVLLHAEIETQSVAA